MTHESLESPEKKGETDPWLDAIITLYRESHVDSDQILKLAISTRKRAYQILGQQEIPFEAREDVFQEAVIATLQKLNEIHNLQAWFCVTIRNRCVVYWRTRRRSLFSAVDPDVLALLAEPIEGGQEAIGTERYLVALLEESNLSPRERTILISHYQNEDSRIETAQRTGYKPSSLLKTRQRILKKMRKAALRLKYKHTGLADEIPESEEIE